MAYPQNVNVCFLEHMLSDCPPLFPKDQFVDTVPWRFTSSRSQPFLEFYQKKGAAHVPIVFTYQTRSNLIMAPPFDALPEDYSRAEGSYIIDIASQADAVNRYLKFCRPNDTLLSLKGVLAISSIERLAPYSKEDLAERRERHLRFDVLQIEHTRSLSKAEVLTEPIQHSVAVFNAKTVQL